MTVEQSATDLRQPDLSTHTADSDCH